MKQRIQEKEYDKCGIDKDEILGFEQRLWAPSIRKLKAGLFPEAYNANYLVYPDNTMMY